MVLVLSRFPYRALAPSLSSFSFPCAAGALLRPALELLVEEVTALEQQGRCPPRGLIHPCSQPEECGRQLFRQGCMVVTHAQRQFSFQFLIASLGQVCPWMVNCCGVISYAPSCAQISPHMAGELFPRQASVQETPLKVLVAEVGKVVLVAFLARGRQLRAAHGIVLAALGPFCGVLLIARPAYFTVTCKQIAQSLCALRGKLVTGLLQHFKYYRCVYSMFMGIEYMRLFTFMFTKDTSDTQSSSSQATPGATAAELTACSPPKANRVPSPAGPLPDFRMLESCRTMLLVGGFSRGSPYCTILTSTTVIGSQDLAVKSRPNLFTHSPRRHPQCCRLHGDGNTVRQCQILPLNGDCAFDAQVGVALIALWFPGLRRENRPREQYKDENTVCLVRRSDELLGAHVIVASNAQNNYGLPVPG
ncbi:hypothetical protein PR048_009841 [Dryococelus australis]|uniref:Uncharacterized protein n=1 Tax=Dryococelus australis TaxID=614101 RepID=A0ABQ9I2W5_9NEOP|nr:hypothetical protein PR048_009841 [Dryococelus australis]